MRFLIRLISTALLSAVFVFVLFRVIGDPMDVLLVEEYPETVRENYRERWGLDEPLSVQVLTFLAGIGRFDFGDSFLTGRPAISMYLERLPFTVLLATLSFCASVSVSIALGTLAAHSPGSIGDRIILGFSVLGYATPNFIIGILLIFWIAIPARAIPTSGFSGPLSMVLPVATIATSQVGSLTRYLRSSLIEEQSREYVEFFSDFGKPAKRILVRDRLPNALIPFLAVAGMQLGGLINGAIVTEAIFALPGIGDLFNTAVSRRDLPVVEASIFYSTLLVVSASAVVNAAVRRIDPTRSDL
jgi:peptide/nickel transport system permease protein